MGGLGNPRTLLIIALLVVLLFGAGKLPSLARNLGQSMRIFKSEVEEMRGDDHGDEDAEPRRRGRARDDRYADDRAAEDRPRGSREYDPREDRYDDREPVRQRDEEDRYRRD